MKSRMTIVILVAIALFSCERIKEQFSSGMLEQIALLPQDANVIGYVNVAKIHSSPFAALLPDSGKFRLDDDMEFEEFVEATGLDPRKDIIEIYGAVKADDKNHEGSGIVVATGQFDKEKIMAYLSAKDSLSRISREQVDGIDIVHLMDNFCLCFADEHTIAGGTAEIIREWLQRKLAGPQQTAVDNERKVRLDGIKYKSTGWLYVDLDNGLDFIKENSKEWRNAAEGVLNLTLSVNVDKNFILYSECECSDAEKAGLLQDAMKGGIATLKLAQSDDRDVIDTLNKVQVKTHDKLVVSRFSMTKEDVERMIEAHKKFNKK